MPDTTLAALFPAMPMTVGGERVDLMPVTVSALPVVERLMEAWCQMVATAGQVVDESAWEDFQDLLAVSVGRPRAWVEALPQAEFERLASLALAMNEAIWNPEAPGDETGKLTWAAIFQRLVEHGHSFESLKGYTFGQVRTFLTEALRQEREELARDIQSAAFSMADGQSVQKVVRELNRE